MAIEAPFSTYKKKNLLIMTVILIGLGVWCIYDGYFNETFIQEHLDEEGNPHGWLVFNQKAPPFLFIGGIIYAVRFFLVKNKKVVAGESGLMTGKTTIPYKAIEKINKTYFDKKGYFVVTYKDSNGQSRDVKISDRTYDNLPAVLDHLVSEIS